MTAFHHSLLATVFSNVTHWAHFHGPCERKQITSSTQSVIFYSGEITTPIIDPRTRLIHTHTQSHNRAWDQNAISMQILAHLQKHFHIQCDCDPNSLFILLNLLIYLYLFFHPFAPSLCLILICWLNAAFVHWPECTGTALFYPPVLVALFIHVTYCPFASSSSVLRRDTDALDSRHIWVAQALIVCQPLRQHH